MSLIASLPTSRLTARQRQGWIGLDIGSATLKLAQVEQRSGKWHLCYKQVIPISGGGLRETLLSTLSGSSGWRRRSVACLLPWSMTELRTLELPPASDDEIAQLVESELCTADSEDFQAAHWPARRDVKPEEVAPVHALTIPSTTVSEVVEAVESANLDCHIVDARPFALARAVAMMPGVEGGKSYAAVDWGFESVSIVLVCDGRPYFTRLLPNTGLRLLIDRLQKRLTLTFPEAAALLLRFRLQTADSPGTDDISAAISKLTREPIDKAAAELRRTTDFVCQDNPSLRPERVLLFGGGATIQGIDERLQQHLAMPVSVWRLEADTTGDPVAAGTTAHFGEAIALSAAPIWK